jgi:hypothetical protein
LFGWSGVQIPAGTREFLVCKMSRTTLGSIYPLNEWVQGFSPEVKQLEREVDHSFLSSAEVRNDWSCTSAPCICLHDVGRDNFTYFSAPIIFLNKFVFPSILKHFCDQF